MGGFPCPGLQGSGISHGVKRATRSRGALAVVDKRCLAIETNSPSCRANVITTRVPNARASSPLLDILLFERDESFAITRQESNLPPSLRLRARPLTCTPLILSLSRTANGTLRRGGRSWSRTANGTLQLADNLLGRAAKALPIPRSSSGVAPRTALSEAPPETDAWPGT